MTLCSVEHIYTLHCPGLLQRRDLRGLAGGAAGGGGGQRGGGADRGGAHLGPRLGPGPARRVDQDEQLRGESWHLLMSSHRQCCVGRRWCECP